MKPLTLYKKLFTEFGPQLWWPVTEEGSVKPTYKKRKHLTEKQKLETCIGAILTQNNEKSQVYTQNLITEFKCETIVLNEGQIL